MSDAIIDELTLGMLARQYPEVALRTFTATNHDPDLRSAAAMRCPACALQLYAGYPPFRDRIHFQFDNDAVGWCMDCKRRLTPMEVLCPTPPSTP